ncbi:zinc metallochaperone AztD [Ruania albidiflava]|uniref:zinc metallochaperone AztD n=1 Tax=Ruania albidiflava TaxID=366586 RepID=UPI0023F2E371|nr:zinc metallochaperone AztD [Ruania albidiflava]
MTTQSRADRRALIALFAAVPLVLTACSTAEPEPPPGGAPSPADDGPPSTEGTEVAAVTPRLVLSYDGGIEVLDATTLEVVGDLPAEGFLRLNAAGDGRHALVSTAEGFQVLDAGSWAVPHGDHSHYYTADPVLTDITYPAQTPGHVVAHDGKVALFDDGTGTATVLDATEVATGPEESVLREYTAPSAHHGVAVALADGTLVVTVGTEEARSGIGVLDVEDNEIAASDQCPGVHGAEAAAEDAVVTGCEDGALIYHEGQIEHAASPDTYGRVGNQAASSDSPIVLGDYKSDAGAELERPMTVSLIDTRTAEITLVGLPSSYSFRSLARGDDGEALVLGTDGAIHVIDPEAGQLERSIPVIDAWEEPEEWQQPRPTIAVADGTAYVSDPEAQAIYAVDLASGEVWNETELTVVPNELITVSGDAEAVSEEDDHAHEEHEHEEHGHDD